MESNQYSKRMTESNQYYVKSNENQYILIYPNYRNNSHKFEVMQSIAEQDSYTQLEQDVFNHKEDFNKRIEDYK